MGWVADLDRLDRRELDRVGIHVGPFNDPAELHEVRHIDRGRRLEVG